MAPRNMRPVSLTSIADLQGILKNLLRRGLVTSVDTRRLGVRSGYIFLRHMNKRAWFLFNEHHCVALFSPSATSTRVFCVDPLMEYNAHTVDLMHKFEKALSIRISRVPAYPLQHLFSTSCLKICFISIVLYLTQRSNNNMSVYDIIYYLQDKTTFYDIECLYDRVMRTL